MTGEKQNMYRLWRIATSHSGVLLERSLRIGFITQTMQSVLSGNTLHDAPPKGFHESPVTKGVHMTRREWLQKNPPPQTAGPLLDRAAELEQQATQQNDPAGKAQLRDSAAKMRQQAAAAPGKCPMHPAVPMYRHQNRQEDLFVCKQGPHFLLWTYIAGRAQFVPLVKFTDLPDLDGPMA